MRFFDRNGEYSLFGSYRHIAELLILICMSWAGYAVLRRMFRAYKAEFLRAGFSGVDLNKPTKPTIPEAQGVLAGAVFITIMFLFIPIPFWRYLFDTDLQRELLFKSQFIHYLAGLLCICCMVFLGFADDALDLPWRHKCLLPSVASLPLLMVYLANEGVTHVVVPTFLRSLLGNTVDIGILYYIYMGLVTVFCTNSINIYAGINGLEVGQTLIIACSVALFNIIELRGYLWRVHLFSLYFLIPFIAVCWALYKVNRFPASVFVGDTFCYFAGMTLAVVGILSHFSKTLMLFFLPQIFNFIYSVPQLFALIPCPRHRLPRYNPDDGLLYTSKVCFHPKSLSVVGEFLLNWCARLKIIECRLVHAYQPPCPKSTLHNSEGDQRSSIASVSSNADDSAKEEIVEVNNFTLINLVLRICGPMSEADTTKKLLLLQIASSCVAFFIRYPIAWLFYSVPIN
ncbi:UDP-N-acetylglucosamine--dolichyl-phosphate N-acetylglucosaminephosphotransferase [Paragonimus westermani]|uniref:UDP-N-acetylglucosamine--dolichyl-phosphate N-acetylglucosaminephosphotransferase n=1 Tax=Paragonimus westermani TaxID=34504 RepID=A0A5J4NXC9_9TREM|nr:UDP-N-acetylglucosamine--dolichyl-phosphate N-acetylglucosaminephosphotransferase [Paragonimus westermani]